MDSDREKAKQLAELTEKAADLEKAHERQKMLEGTDGVKRLEEARHNGRKIKALLTTAGAATGDAGEQNDLRMASVYSEIAWGLIQEAESRADDILELLDEGML